MISGHALTEAIYNNIANTYHKDMKPYLFKYLDNNRFAVDHVTAVTMNILSQVAATAFETGKRGEYERDHLFQTIFQQIWIWYPGGTTAANCAGRIFDDLGLDWPRDGKF